MIKIAASVEYDVGDTLCCSALSDGLTNLSCCFLVAAISLSPIIGLIACAVTGFCTSMLWPGTLVAATSSLKSESVFIFAIMAAGGDLGASIAPQLMGIVIDTVAASNQAAQMSITSGLTTEQIGMKAGMLVTALFPIIGIIVVLSCIRYFKKKKA